MKKLLKTVLILTLFFGVGGCGSNTPKKPEDINQTTYDNGQKALKIMDKYLDGDMTLDDAASEIKILYNGMHGQSDLESCIRNTSYTFALTLTNSKFQFSGLDVSKLKEYRDNLEKYLKGKF